MMVNIIAVLLVAPSIFLLVVGAADFSAVVSALVLLAFAVYWLLLRKTVTNWWVGRGFDKRPDANALVEWTFSEEKIKAQCEGLASSEFQWKLIINVVETNDGFLFYIHKNLFHWLPFSAFQEPEGIGGVREFVKSKGVNYAIQDRAS
jgi:hypothetical protein